MISPPPPPPLAAAAATPDLKFSTISDDDYHNKVSGSGSDDNHTLAKLGEEDEEHEDEIDLLKSDFDDTNPLPKFSIRDYVFSSRSKGIAANWPFSQKNLQLCLKHGVKNLLPPFHSLDLLRDSSATGCGVETTHLPDEEILSASGDEKPSTATTLALDSVVSTTSSELKLSQPHHPLPANKSSCSDLQAYSLAEVSGSEEESKAPLASDQKKAREEEPVRKCHKLVVNLNTAVESVSTNQDTMASSKVCPVCKTFSSSSNTTLNAHIDQCLSGESTMKWPANSKVVIKNNRIKPRKTRLMVDIYVTAPRCTLEELDRRNGTSWATNSSFPAQEIEFHREENEKEKEMMEREKDQKVPAINLQDTATHEGAVYIDTNGTKVRILSVPTLGSGNDHVQGSRKLVKGGKGGKLLASKKKKKLHDKKHHKSLNLAPDSKKICSLKARHDFEVRDRREDNCAVEGRKEDRQKVFSEAQRDGNLGGLKTIRPWACSKRTRHAKKSSGTDDNMHSRSNHTKSSSCSEKGFMSRTPSSSDNIVSSSKSSKRTETSSNEFPVARCREQPLLRPRLGPHSGSPVGGCSKKKSLLSAKQGIQQLKSGGEFSQGNSGENIEDHIASNKAVETDANTSKKYDGFDNSSRPNRFSSLKKNLLSESRETIPAFKLNLKRKFSDEKSLVNGISDKDAVLGSSHVERLHSSMKERSRREEADATGFNVRKMVKKEAAIRICGREGSTTLKSSSRFSDRGNVDYPLKYDGAALADSFGDDESSGEEIQTDHGEEVIVNNATKMDVEGSSMSPDQFHKVASPADVQFDEMSQVPFCGSEGPLYSTKPSLGNNEKILHADEIGNGREFADSRDMEHGNYFREVEPIPIPGPPGSFLPSPGGDMVSEDVQGHSSLTSSRVQSCEDHHDMADRDSLSDSPISATSTISNSTSAGFDLRSSEKLSLRSLGVQDELKPDTIEEKSAAAPVSVAANTHTGADQTHDEDDWRANPMIFTEKGQVDLKKDHQPCCCSRKEAISHNVASDYQESGQLRRRNYLDSTNKRPASLNLKSEMLYLGNYPSSAPETPVPPSTILLAADSAVKFPVHGDCDSAASPSSKPVLRLMGKNLTVAKKDEDEVSPQLKPPAPMINQHPSRQFSAASPGQTSCGNFQNQEYSSYHPLFPQGYLTFDKTPSDFRSHNGDMMKPQMPIHASETMHPYASPRGLSGGVYYGFGGHNLDSTPYSQPRIRQDHHNIERNEYNGGSSLPNTEQTRIWNNRLDHNHSASERNINGYNPTVKEIIVIDDSSENETESAKGSIDRTSRRNRVPSLPGIPIQSPLGYDSRNMNPVFYNYHQSPNASPPPYSTAGSTPMARNAGFLSPGPPPFREANAPMWNCAPEGSSRSMLHHTGSLAASSPSTLPLRSAVLYNYPPGYS